MIRSMTAFAREELQNPIGTFIWEIRTVNHRYLDISFRVPEVFRELEPLLREKVGRYIKRGKVECRLQYQLGEQAEYDLKVNTLLVEKVSAAVLQVKSYLKETTSINLFDILRWPDVLYVKEGKTPVIRDRVLELFDKTLDSLNKTREREGEKLSVFLQEKIDQLFVEVSKTKQYFPQILEKQKLKLLERLEEIRSNLDEQRLEQEMLYLAQKTDIEEELSRLNMHLQEIKRVLIHDPAAGKRLDFLMQELNREANTVAAKSISEITTYASVEMKVLIEQMREQIQNLE